MHSHMTLDSSIDGDYFTALKVGICLLLVLSMDPVEMECVQIGLKPFQRCVTK